MALTKKTKQLLLLVILFVAVFTAYNYLYPSHRNIETEAAAFTVTAKDLLTAFKTDESTATTKYIDKTITITGNLSSVEGAGGSLDNAVFFTLNDINTRLLESKTNTTIHVKGRCIGYDNLLEEVKIDQATIK